MREAYYADTGRPEDKPVEDKIARRMIKAVGYSNAEKGIAAYELERRGEVNVDMPLWPRTRQMLYDLAQTHGHDSHRLDIQAFAVKSAKELDERLAAGAAGARKPVYIVLENNEAYVYTLCDRHELADQRIPFQASTGPAGSVVVRQSALTFARAYLGMSNDHE